MQPSRAITEDVLISRCKKGDLKYQELLYKQYYSYAMGISVRYSYNRDDAMEAVNDAFIKVFKSIATYNPDKAFKGWLRSIVINTAIDRRRRDTKHQMNVELDEAAPVFELHSAVNNLQANDILKMMELLPSLQRTIFNLFEIDGYDHDEIAKMVNISVGASRVYLSRAKERMRLLLTNETKRHG